MEPPVQTFGPPVKPCSTSIPVRGRLRSAGSGFFESRRVETVAFSSGVGRPRPQSLGPQS